jgi:hypothetical protein
MFVGLAVLLAGRVRKRVGLVLSTSLLDAFVLLDCGAPEGANLVPVNLLLKRMLAAQ